MEELARGQHWKAVHSVAFFTVSICLLCFSVCFSLRLPVHRYSERLPPPVRKISELCELFAPPQATAHTTTNKNNNNCAQFDINSLAQRCCCCLCCHFSELLIATRCVFSLGHTCRCVLS